MNTMRNRLRLPGGRLAALAAAGCLLVAPRPAYASGYWSGFKKFWFSFIADTDGAVLAAIVVGAIALFIITRGKWGKSH